jgi:hypothetical protein
MTPSITAWPPTFAGLPERRIAACGMTVRERRNVLIFIKNIFLVEWMPAHVGHDKQKSL